MLFNRLQQTLVPSTRKNTKHTTSTPQKHMIATKTTLERKQSDGYPKEEKSDLQSIGEDPKYPRKQSRAFSTPIYFLYFFYGIFAIKTQRIML